MHTFIIDLHFATLVLLSFVRSFIHSMLNLHNNVIEDKTRQVGVQEQDNP